MISYLELQLELRKRVRALAVCTTGSTVLAATSTGYARTVGSFLADGFAPGMELTAAGFAISANNGTKVVQQVTATTLVCTGCVAEAASSGKTLSVGLPAQQSWENMDFTPEAGRPFIAEQFVPGPVQQVTVGPGGDVEYLPMYILDIFAPLNVGVAALHYYADALLALFPPRFAMTLPSGIIARMRTDTGPFRGQMRRTRDNWVSVQLTFPLWLRAPNTI